MNKFYVSIIVVTLLAGAYSCQKDAPNRQATQEDEMIKQSEKVVLLIQQFDMKMENSLKSNETLTLDSAVWNMEASVNYNYANPEEAVGEYSFSKHNYTLEVDANGEVSMDVIQAVYAQMEQELGTSYKSGDESVLVFSDVALDSISGSTAYLSGTNGFSSGTAHYYTPIDDDWYWGTLGEEYGNSLLGNCSGTDLTSDASNELAWRLNHPMPVPTYEIFYINIETLYASGFDFDDAQQEPRLYVGWSYPDDDCLSIDTLTYYLNQSDDIIYTYQSSGGLRPANKSFVSVYIRDDLAYNEDYSWYYHRYEVTYGTPTLVPPPH